MGFFDFLKGASNKTATAATGAAKAGSAATAGVAAAATAGAATSMGAAAAAGTTTVVSATAAEESAISSLLGEGGAKLTGLLDKLKLGGLDDMVKSWIGTGENKAMTGDQVKASLGKDDIAAVASKLGISEEEAVAKIAKVLPGIIDKLTPDGLVPDPSAIANKLTGLLK